MSGEPRGVVVRAAGAPADWRAVRDLCCLTGEGGDPIAPDRWRFFAERWIGPYQRLRPEWTYVADRAGEIIGYLTGCPDTAAFARDRRLAVTLPLLVRVAGGRHGWTDDTRRFVRQALGLATTVERGLPPDLSRRLRAEYPAHLHMNVAAAGRGRGTGTALIERYLADLAARGVPGVHLLCGPGPVRFYTRAGFGELQSLATRSGPRVHILGRRVG